MYNIPCVFLLVSVKKSDNFLLYALLTAGSIFAIIIIVYFSKEVRKIHKNHSNYELKCIC